MSTPSFPPFPGNLTPFNTGLIPPHSPKTVSLKLSKFQLPPPSTPSSSPAQSTSSATSSAASKAVPSFTKLAGKHLKVKATRSKAWVESYGSSNDPIKILLAAVYSYHDNTGEYVAQPFIDLPSKKVIHHCVHKSILCFTEVSCVLLKYPVFYRTILSITKSSPSQCH